MKFEIKNLYKEDGWTLKGCKFTEFTQELDELEPTDLQYFPGIEESIKYFVDLHNETEPSKRNEGTELEKLCVLWDFAHECWNHTLMGCVVYRRLAIRAMKIKKDSPATHHYHNMISLFCLWGWG